MSAPLLSTDVVDSYGKTLLQRVAATQLGPSRHFNASALVTLEQGNDIEIIAITFAGLSTLASICGVYWFLVMRRNFRRDLILLLIVGDLWKSIWFGISAATTYALGRPGPNSKWCLASGYLLFTGIESCDWAIFFQGLHLYLQVFPPRNSPVGYDGLYRARNWVLAAWFILPNVSASMAFVNNSRAYVSQGGFCTLPIRPFWYRLALSWIPRYLIWIFTMWVAVRIYTHVGYEFKVFGVEKNESSNAATNVPISAATARARTLMSRSPFAPRANSYTEKHHLPGDEDVGPDDDRILPAVRDTDIASTPGTANRDVSTLEWPASIGQFNDSDQTIVPHNLGQSNNRSSPSSRRGSKNADHGVPADDYAALAIELESARGSFSSKHSSKSSGPHVFDLPATLSPIKEVITPRPSPPHTRTNAGTRAMQLRRQAIQRQLRLLFIYPVVYLLMWILPFVSHAMSYSDYYAQHPIFAIRILNIFFQCLMGFVDVSVFCWREKPWRHIPGSDGTFLGSFCFWRFAFGIQWHESRRASRHLASSASNGEAVPGSITKRTDASLFGRWGRWAGGKGSASQRESYSSSGELRTPKRTGFGGGVSDRRAMELDNAQERLQLERREWEQKLRDLQANPPTSSRAPPTSLTRKEWWESRLMSIDDEE